MKRRLFIGLIVALLAAMAITVVLRTRSDTHVAVYQGRTAEQWLQEVFTTNQGAAMQAFREMGTNALPVVLRAFEKQDSAWDNFYQVNFKKLPAVLQKHLTPPFPAGTRWNAAELVALNNPAARTQLPEFTRLLAEKNNPAQLYILSLMVGWFTPADTNAVGILIQCLQEPDPAIKKDSAMGLSRIGLAAKKAVPALTGALKDRDDVRLQAASALWRIDRQTNTAEGVFREIMSTGNSSDSGWATIYLSEMEPNDLSLIPNLLRLLGNRDEDLSMSAAFELGKYGPVAKEAVPNLIKTINALPANNFGLRLRVLDSLQKIDPEAAAKYEKK